MAHEKRSSLAIQGIIGVWVSQKLGQENFKNIDHV
jgi:hypothetical protein